MSKHSILISAALALSPAPAMAVTPPPGGGTISIEPTAADGDYDPAMRTFVDAAAEALAARGFTILDDPGHAAFVAELILTRSDVGTARGRAPAGSASVRPGLSPGAGAGVVIPFSTGKSTLVPLQRTQLELRIRKRGEDQVAWHAAAVTVRQADPRSGGDRREAADLSEAVLRSYPAEPAEVVGVP